MKIFVNEAPKLLVATLVSSLLLGCGGSDSKDSNQEPQYLSLDATRFEGCNTTNADVSALFIVHDKDGQIIAEHQTDTNGHLEIEWTDDSQHLTKISFNDPQDLSSAIEVVSYLNVPAADLGHLTYWTQTDSTFSSYSACGGQEILLNLEQLKIEAAGQELIIGQKYFQIDRIQLSTETPAQLPIYWDPTNGYLTIQLIDPDNITAKAFSLNPSQNTEYQLTVDDFTSEGVRVNAERPTENSWLSAYTGYYEFLNSENFHTDLIPMTQLTEAPIFIYPDFSNSAIVMASEYTNSSLTGLDVFIGSHTHQAVDAEGNAPELSLLAYDENLQYEAEHIWQQLEQEANTLDFDFSHVDPNISASYITIFEGYTGEPTSEWIIYTGREGSIPDLDLPEVAKTTLATMQDPYLRIGLYKQGEHMSWPEWLKLGALESRTEDKANSLYYTNSHYIYLSIEMNQ